MRKSEKERVFAKFEWNSEQTQLYHAALQGLKSRIKAKTENAVWKASFQSKTRGFFFEILKYSNTQTHDKLFSIEWKSVKAWVVCSVCTTFDLLVEGSLT